MEKVSSIPLRKEKTIRAKKEKMELNIRFVIRKDINPEARLDIVDIKKKKKYAYIYVMSIIFLIWEKGIWIFDLIYKYV